MLRRLKIKSSFYTFLQLLKKVESKCVSKIVFYCTVTVISAVAAAKRQFCGNTEVKKGNKNSKVLTLDLVWQFLLPFFFHKIDA